MIKVDVCRQTVTFQHHGIINYTIVRTIVCKTVKENNLGVTMNANVNVSKEHRIGLKSVNKIYGTFNFIFQHTDVQICNRTRLCTC